MDIVPVRTARDREERDRLLREAGLAREGEADFSVLLLDGDEAVGTASRKGSVLKWFALSPSRRGEGLSGMLLTALVKEALEEGIAHLFIVTKPGEVVHFRPYGFFLIARTERMALLENQRDGLSSFLRSLEGKRTGRVGAVVMHADPFTLGHQALVRWALEDCDWLHLFVVSTPGGYWTPEERLSMVEEGTAACSRLSVHSSGEYLVSPATFPAYFLKDRAKEAQAELDIALFCDAIAPSLGIRVRYVGSEPSDPVTASYNRMLHSSLPPRGIEVAEMERIRMDGEPVSARRVRSLLERGEREEAKRLVPPTTVPFLLTARTNTPRPTR